MKDIEVKHRKEFGSYLREKRLAAGLAQASVSEKCGYSNPQYVSNIERGEAWPPMHMMIEMCTLYKIPRSEMLKVLTECRTKIWSEQMGVTKSKVKRLAVNK